MSILSELNALLETTGIPVETGVFSGVPPDEYVVLTPLNDSFVVFGDNKPHRKASRAKMPPKKHCKSTFLDLSAFPYYLWKISGSSDMCYLHALRTLQPFFLLLANTAFPSLLLVLLRKPCFRFLFRFDFLVRFFFTNVSLFSLDRYSKTTDYIILLFQVKLNRTVISFSIFLSFFWHLLFSEKPAKSL